MNVLVLGYYNRNNLGDDMFEYVFSVYFAKFWPQAIITFANTDDLQSLPAGVDVVILGAGGVIVPYFIDKVTKLMAKAPANIPLYAIGVGVPYLANIPLLDQFDYVIHREQFDQDLLVQRYSSQQVRWYPDLGYLLPQYAPTCDVKSLAPEFYDLVTDGVALANANSTDFKVKKIGVFLTRTMYNANDPNSYNQIVTQLATFLLSLAQMKRNRKVFFQNCLNSHNVPVDTYSIYFFPFNDSPNAMHDDRIMNRDIVNKMEELGGHCDNVYLIDVKPDSNQVVTIFKSFYATICSRFHAHVFSLISEVPLISVSTTRKVANLLTEFDLTEYAVGINTNADDYPISLQSDTLMAKWVLLEQNYNTYKKKISVTNKTYINKMNEFQTTLTNLLFYKFRCINPQTVQDNATVIASRIQYRFKLSPKTTADITTKPGALAELFALTPQSKTELAQIVSYSLTNSLDSIYSWGLVEKILTPSYSLYESCEWILTDQGLGSRDGFLGDIVPRNMRKINTQLINFNLLKGYHRSGWNFVVSNIDLLHNPQGVLFDCYLDKTFGWDNNFLVGIGVVPYTTPWVGVLHHTPNTEYSDNNLVNLFKNASFLASLPQCKGLIVFSDYIRNWVCARFPANGPLVQTLYHPTETVDTTFDYNRFLANPNKKVLQIGGWLRNSYAIYALPTPKGFVKCALKWKGMDNYFITPEQLLKIEECLFCVGNGGNENCCGTVVSGQYICPGTVVSGQFCPGTVVSGQYINCSGLLTHTQSTNKYVVGLMQLIQQNHASVNILDMISNTSYDQLLAENVVFINLYDASAVNTVIECIVRNTPICVNRLPALEEYLGVDYPMYYTTFEEAAEKISCAQTIKDTTMYLSQLDKSKFTIKTFMNDLIQSTLYQEL